MKNVKRKNTLFIKDINSNEQTITFRLFRYFYSLYEERKELKSFIKCILFFIENIQFISYAFTHIHYNSWKIEYNFIRFIIKIIEGFRLSSLMRFIDYKYYSVIFYLIVILIFLFFLIVVLQILFIESSSKIYNFSMSIIRILIELNVIILYIPIIEIILMPNKCVNGIVYDIKNAEICDGANYYLKVALGITGTFIYTFWCIFLINFSFYPFQKIDSTGRITSSNDIIIIIMKLACVLQNLLIKDEYLSLAILLLISITILFSDYKEATYNNEHLEYIIFIKNANILYTYFVLLFCKFFENIIPSGFLYLLVFGYPIIIYLSIVIIREKYLSTIYLSGNNESLNEYIMKAKFNMKLIDSFLERNRNMRVGNETEGQRNLILLKGNIKFHNLVCTDKECPLKRFLLNEGNFNAQRQCLLNYMNMFFNKGLRKYPNNIYLLMLYVRFNYSKRFNLNSVKTNISTLKKLKSTTKEKYTIYCMEQNIINNYDNGMEVNFDNNTDNDSPNEMIDQKYQNLKYLIENSIKLFGEFWGIFESNVSSNINTNKLYTLGEKLNVFLKEINNIWDTELKNKKIGNEHQSIVQLYSKFLLEILWDRNKSRNVYKKLNDDINNYQMNDNRKAQNENKGKVSIEELVDNQDFIIFGDLDEKGGCKIIQCSASFTNSLGYQKSDIIGKSLDIILPNFLSENFCKYLEEYIKSLHIGENNQKELSYQENDSNKNSQLLIIKTRMGYIFPLYASLRIIIDNDYTDSFLIRIKMEMKEARSEYAYYILANSDLTIENISSSAINLGLTLDLLKKYMIKINNLVRTEDDYELNIFESYTMYEEPKTVTWVFPHLIYPKENNHHIKEEDIGNLIEKSKRKKFYLLIKPIKYNENDDISLVFKFTEITEKNKKKKLNIERYIPKCNKNLILFDLLNLNYIRTLVVNQKSGFRNLRNIEEEKEKEKCSSNKNILEVKKSNKRKKSSVLEEKDLPSSSDELDKNKSNNLLTKEKIMELQGYNYLEIKNFIFSLPLYGSEVNLEKFTPNGEKYSASKIKESLINIQISKFCKKIEEKLGADNFKKKKIKFVNNINKINSFKNQNSDNDYMSQPNSENQEVHPTSSSMQGEEVNKGIASDNSSTFINVFRVNTITYIKILVSLFFLITFLLIIADFLIVFYHINNLTEKIKIFQNGYIILNDILYIKYFVTEGVIGNLVPSYFPIMISGGRKNFFQDIKNELTFYRKDFTEVYNTFSSSNLCKEYRNFMASTNIILLTYTIDRNDSLTLLFNTAMNRIPSSVNNLLSDESLIVMNNRDTYELMYNLLNEYYVNWKKVVIILYEDCVKSTKLILPLFLIAFGYLAISFILVIFFLKLLSQFSLDRERPINLFLTLKKQVFENLKSSAENFSNKILNQFFGNEDNEDESQQDYQSNIQSKDINIIKFKTLNENYFSIKKAFTFMNIIIIILIFIFINFVYFASVYFNCGIRLESICNFLLLFDKNNLSQTHFILSLDIFKSYLFNKSIPILNQTNMKEIFYETFMDITDKFEDIIILTSKTNSFLSGEYLEKYIKYLEGDFSELLDESNYFEENKELLERKMRNGIKPIKMRVFEIINYLIIKYCKSDNILNEDNNISFILKEREFKLYEITLLLQKDIRNWYNNVLKLMIDSYYDFDKSGNFVFIMIFTLLIVFIILYYSIIWKANEEKLNILLKRSVDLINLIPQEIKNILIDKLNE